jgi:hypothetical protein
MPSCWWQLSPFWIENRSFLAAGFTFGIGFVSYWLAGAIFLLSGVN